MSNRSRARRPTRPGGPPAWLVFLIGVALVFGLFYLWQGVQNFFRTGGRGVVEATERAIVVSSATAERISRSPLNADNTTPRPTNTPVPECQDFVVDVPNAIVRDAPTSNGAILTSYNEGTTVCVLGLEPDTEWYVIDQTPETRRLDLAYMHETVIRAVNPTPTPSITPTRLPTVTPVPTDTPSITPSPRPNQPTAAPTEDANAAPTLPSSQDEPTEVTSPTPTDVRRFA